MNRDTPFRYRLSRQEAPPLQTIMARFSLLGALVMITLVLGSCQHKERTLRLLVWEGYADPVFVRPFELSHHCKVEAFYMKTSDELYDNLRHPKGGEEYDIVSPSSDIAQTIVDDDLAAPLDNAPLFKDRAIVSTLRAPLLKGKKVYAVPFMWGPNLLLYDEEAFAEGPPSGWSVLWDPQYRHRVAVWDDLSTIYMAAQLLGCENRSSACGYAISAPPDSTVIFNLGQNQLKRIEAELLVLQPRQWSTATELTSLFERHEVVAAMGWPLITNQLRKSGFPIGELVPKEGTTGWIDYLMIPKASRQKDLAHQFLDYLRKPETQRWVAEVTGYAPTDDSPATMAQFTPDERAVLHLYDKRYSDKVYLWQPIPERGAYERVWQDVKESWTREAKQHGTSH
jgi:spermidine/putrescine-binding protein